MTEKKTPRRFIAGATCPKCSAIDTIVMFKENDVEVRECVDCGFKDEMRFKPQAKELETRVNKTEEEKESEVQVIQFPPPNTIH